MPVFSSLRAHFLNESASLSIAVICGGQGVEREVSLSSGRSCYQALMAQGLHAFLLDPTEQGWQDRLHECDLALIMLHGAAGENGTIQGYLEMMAIPYVGTGVLGSSLAMHKGFSKQVVAALGLSVPVAQEVQTLAQAQAFMQMHGTCVVKPVDGGSSVGVSIVQELDALPQAFEAASRLGSVMIEVFIPGYDVAMTVIQGQPLPSVSVHPQSGFYDYQAKYLRTDTVYKVGDLPEAIESKLAQQALVIAQALHLRHFGRVDFRYNPVSQESYFIEINTIPGMTMTSLVPKAAAAVGLSYADLVVTLCALGWQDARLAQATSSTSCTASA